MKSTLRALRDETQLDTGRAPRRASMSRGKTINAIETGRDEPSLSLAFKIARLFEAADRADLQRIGGTRSLVGRGRRRLMSRAGMAR